MSFVRYSPQHWTMIAFLLILAIGLPVLLRMRPSEKLKRGVVLSLAATMFFAKVTEPFYRVALGDPWQLMLPLHLCDISAVFACIMLVTRNQLLYELTYFWGFGGALQAILTPSLENGFPHIDYYYYFITHGFIIVMAVFATAVLGMRPKPGAIKRAFLATLAYAAIIAPVNLLLDANYLYLRAKPQTSSLMDYLGPWPWYLVSLVPVSIVIYGFYYSPFWFSRFVKRRAAA